MNGVYLLEITITTSTKIAIGALGCIAFQKGCYLYVGSAQNGLEQRIARHYHKEKKLHWHIDYLLADDEVRLTGHRCEPADKSRECELARSLLTSAMPVPGFGSSDCQCVSHLFRLTHNRRRT